MEAVIFVGLQGSGKSTFFEQRFAATHARINLDTLKTRHREQLLLESCRQRKIDFVVDNTNPAAEDRARYIQPARAAGYRVIGYYFDCDIRDCLKRNAARAGKAKVHPAGIYSARKRLKPPTLAEGFDAIYHVQLKDDGAFYVAPIAGDATAESNMYGKRSME